VTLTGSTLYTSTEPCAMCAGAICWSGIGRVIFALSEESLYALTGPEKAAEAVRLPCRELFARCGRHHRCGRACSRRRGTASA
jgi:tRNA(Arg) A34 adenosine deaminase TadA